MIVGGVQMPTTFFTPERLEEMWGYIKWFLSYNMPIFMTCMAALIAWIFLDEIIAIFNTAREDQQNDRRSRHDDDDDDD